MPLGPYHVRAILFDLWNTLIYSDYHPNPMLTLTGALGIEGRPGWKKIIERGMMRRRHLGFREGLAGVEAEAGRELDPGRREELIRTWNLASSATRFFDDALPALEPLSRRYRLGIISNTQSFDLEILRRPELSNIIDALCLSCDLGRLKPDPDMFLEAVRMLGSRPAETLMVGDSWEDDVEGAMAAGLQSVHLDRSRPRSGSRSGIPVIGNLTGISSLLA